MLEHLLKGGYLIWPLFFLSILSLAIIIDRLRAFRLAEEIESDGLFKLIVDYLEKDNLETAIRVCQEAKGPVAAVMLVGLYKYQMLVERGKSDAEIEEYLDKTMSEYAPHVLEGLEKRLNLLLMIASVSPLLGMTGTVTGMITSFDVMKGLGGLDAGAVAGGISEALITTATGLIIAIPAVVFYYVFSKKVDALRLEIEEKANDLVEYITLYLGKKSANED